MGLETYHEKRDFRRTPEPKGKVSKVNRRRFVVQEHHASKLHFDFRLEMGGVLKSWSVPRGPSLDPAEKRLAVPTEDHPVEYLKFEGHIPEGEYGAGEHMLWDGGTYEPLGGGDALEQLEKGRLSFRLKGEKLRGEFSLVRMSGRRSGQWLLVKADDEFAEPGWQLQLRLDTDESAREFLRREQGAGPRASKARRSAPKEVRRYSSRAAGEGAKTLAAARAFEGELAGDLNVEVGGKVVALTSLDRVYWPDDGYTKGDLVRYYYEIAGHILPYLKGRPLIMKRYPSGIGGGSFHQHDVDEVPDFVRTVSLEVGERGGHTVDYIVGDNLPTLLYMANLGAVERHPWHSRTRNLDSPDWVVFDLDPGEGVRFETVCEAALAVRDVLGEVGLEGHAKTSGSRGIHVYVPLRPGHDYVRAAAFAERVATLVARRMPETATVERSLKRRGPGQIYVDHMQNARGKSVVGPYSVRPRPGAPVSAPLRWDEVAAARITPQDFNIRNILARVEREGDLFKEVLTGRQSLKEADERAAALVKETRPRRARGRA